MRDFRSIASIALTGIEEVVPLVGLNGSGKSNLLRALNVFFTGHVERGDPLDLARDFREPRRKVKSRIEVEVDLDYEVFGSLRKDLEEALVRVTGGGKHITVRKEWTLTEVRMFAGAEGAAVTAVAPDVVPAISRLLEVVRFRYVPNHVHPSQILQDEQESIRRLLVSRLAKRQSDTEEVIKRIREISADLMEPIRTAMEEATGSVAAVELATPSDWKEMAWAFGLKLKGSQTESFEALLHGSGVQSVLAYNILHAIDTSFGDAFGWRKGAVWALEEPESFLHSGLQAELARTLSGYAVGNPLQVLFSTHSAAFMGVASSGISATLDGSGRTEVEVVERPALLRLAYTSGVASFSHPLHLGPPKPVLLVEGKGDRDLLLRAYREGRVLNPYWILCLEDIDPKLQGGDEVARWLKYNQAAIAARPLTSPIVALRDWESKVKPIEDISKALAPHATSRCIAWDAACVNTDLSENFVGIERFLSTAYIEHAQADLAMALKLPADPAAVSWKYDVDQRLFKEAKPAIHRDLADRAIQADIAPLVAALPWLNDLLNHAPPDL